jgi:hypothetical protein
LVPQEGMELDTVVSGSAGKRTTAERGDDRNGRNSKRSALMRVCMAGEGSGGDLGGSWWLLGLAMGQVAVK